MACSVDLFCSFFADEGFVVAIKMKSQDWRQTGEVQHGISHSCQIPIMFRSQCHPFHIAGALLATFLSSNTMQLASLLLAVILTHMGHRGWHLQPGIHCWAS